MSETIVTQEENFLHVDYDKSKLVLFGGRFDKADFRNNTGAQATFEIGTILGRENTTGQLVPLDLSNALLGEDHVAGVLNRRLVDVADAGVVEDVSFLIGGDVTASKVSLVADSITDANSAGLTIEADLQRVGVKLVEVNELYDFDNA